MKKYFAIFTASLLFALSLNAVSHAANSGKITKEEAELWKQAFDEEIETTPKQVSTPSESKQQADISGNWVGYYEYDSPQGQPEGMFNAVIIDVGNEFGITFLEPRNYSKEYVQVAINTTAKRQGKYIEFTKVYTHNKRTKIQYNLTISHNGSIMSGTWKIDNNTYGRAFFYKVNLKNLKEVKAETID